MYTDIIATVGENGVWGFYLISPRGLQEAKYFKKTGIIPITDCPDVSFFVAGLQQAKSFCSLADCEIVLVEAEPSFEALEYAVWKAAQSVAKKVDPTPRITLPFQPTFLTKEHYGKG